MLLHDFNDLPSKVNVKGFFDETSKFNISRQALDSLENNRLKIIIEKIGGKVLISGLNVSISSLYGNVIIRVGDDNAEVVLDNNTTGNYDFRLWSNSSIIIGKQTTSNGVRVICDNSSFRCGEDCMFSDRIIVQSADQHGIVNIKTGKIVKKKSNEVVLGNHVWLGRQCILTSNAIIGEGSVIGAGAIVTGDIPDKVIAAGVPARVSL